VGAEGVDVTVFAPLVAGFCDVPLKGKVFHRVFLLGFFRGMPLRGRCPPPESRTPEGAVCGDVLLLVGGTTGGTASGGLGGLSGLGIASATSGAAGGSGSGLGALAPAK